MRGLAKAPPAGTKVQETAYFLRSMGVLGGSQWLTLAPDDCGVANCYFCHNGRHIAINEPEPKGADEVSTRSDGQLMRHIALCHIQVVGRLPNVEDTEFPVTDQYGPKSKGVKRKRVGK